MAQAALGVQQRRLLRHQQVHRLTGTDLLEELDCPAGDTGAGMSTGDAAGSRHVGELLVHAVEERV